MSEVTSQVRIINRALILLGSTSRLASIDDPTTIAGQFKDLWHESRRGLLICHPWKIALKRAHLNEDAVPPAFQYAMRYKIPADCLRWLPSRRDDVYWFDGELENGYLLTNVHGGIDIRYIADIDNIPEWPAYLSEALAYRLAMEAAEFTTAVVSNVQEMAQKFEMVLSDAKGMNAQESGNRSLGNIEVTSRWLGAMRRHHWRDDYCVPGRF